MTVDLVNILKPTIDRIVDGLADVEFNVDPLCGPHYSRITSILSSAYKRHGRIIEIALREGLQENPHLQVWSEKRFAISTAADVLVNVNLQSQEACQGSELPYGEQHRSIQIDVGTYNRSTRKIAAYEIKRGNGWHDAGKVRSMWRDKECTRLLLKSYGRLHDMDANTADVKVVFYYGIRSIPAPHSLVREELNNHFGCPITEKIEAVNTYYRQRLHELLGRI